MKATGINGAMELRGDSLVITRKLFFGRSKGEKAIQITSISALQFKRSGLTSGFLQIAFSGSGESKGGVFDAAKDENTILFTKKTQAEFETLRDEIERRRTSPHSPASALRSDPVTEIERYADLHSRRLITDEEFAAKKRQLLDL